MDRPVIAADLAIEPVEGYRVWRLTGEGAGIRLAAVTRRSIWPTLEPMRASCPEHLPEDVPGSDCMCGLYAASSLRSLVRAGVLQRRTVGVVGAISMWGRVVEHDRGSRSSLAYPARLRLVCGPCLSERRGPVDPLEVVLRDGERVPVCARHLEPQELGAPAADVEAHLLDAYAVEQLPGEVARRGLGHRPVAGAVLRRLDTAPRIPDRLRMPTRVVAVAATALLLMLGVLTLPRPSGEDARAAPPGAISVSRVVTPSAAPGPDPAATISPPSAPQKRLPSVLCAVVEGGALQRVACREGRADAVGVTSAPPAAPSSCDGDLEWYTRGRTWSVCWFVGLPALADLERGADRPGSRPTSGG